jgi:hypothetical protein
MVQNSSMWQSGSWAQNIPMAPSGMPEGPESSSIAQDLKSMINYELQMSLKSNQMHTQWKHKPCLAWLGNGSLQKCWQNKWTSEQRTNESSQPQQQCFRWHPYCAVAPTERQIASLWHSHGGCQNSDIELHHIQISFGCKCHRHPRSDPLHLYIDPRLCLQDLLEIQAGFRIALTVSGDGVALV